MQDHAYDDFRRIKLGRPLYSSHNIAPINQELSESTLKPPDNLSLRDEVNILQNCKLSAKQISKKKKTCLHLEQQTVCE